MGPLKVLVIPADGEAPLEQRTLVATEDFTMLDLQQQIVGGLIEPVEPVGAATGRNVLLWVNEEFLYTGAPANIRATMFAHAIGRTDIPLIFGDCFLTALETDDDEYTLSVPDDIVYFTVQFIGGEV